MREMVDFLLRMHGMAQITIGTVLWNLSSLVIGETCGQKYARDNKPTTLFTARDETIFLSFYFFEFASSNFFSFADALLFYSMPFPNNDRP